MHCPLLPNRTPALLANDDFGLVRAVLGKVGWFGHSEGLVCTARKSNTLGMVYLFDGRSCREEYWTALLFWAVEAVPRLLWGD